MIGSASRYIIGAMIGAAVAYMVGRADGRSLAEGEDAIAERVAMVAAEKARKATAAEIAKIEVRHTTIRQTLEKEIREKPVYLACRHTPDGLRLINGALGSIDPGKLPRLDATK